MAERWCKFYAGTMTDAKFLAVAAECGQSRLLVSGTFAALLDYTTGHHPKSGSIAGFDPRVWAAWADVAVETIEQVISSLRSFGLLIGDTIANWGRRQQTAEAETPAGESDRSPARTVAARERMRRRREEDRKQIPMLLPLPGGDAACGKLDANSANSANRGANSAPETVCGKPENALCSNAVRSVRTREENRGEQESFRKKSEGDSGARCARLAKPPPPDSTWLKARKREALISKLFRFASATMAPAKFEEACAGLMADDNSEAQRWIDRLDREMRQSGWDDRKAA